MGWIGTGTVGGVLKLGRHTGYVSGEIAGMPDIFIRSLLMLLPFAIPYPDQFDEDDRERPGRAPAARNEGALA